MSDDLIRPQLDKLVGAIQDARRMIDGRPEFSVQVELGVDACAALIKHYCACHNVADHKTLTKQMVFRTHPELLTPGKLQLFGYPLKVLHSGDSMMDIAYRNRWSISVSRGELNE